ncbi:MAG: hypothetical protein H7322_02690 [Ramlibacter sp.]|nr:hypothetical protein [Ramlibacter sp.]
MSAAGDIRTTAQQSNLATLALSGEPAQAQPPLRARSSSIVNGLTRHDLLSAHAALRIGKTRRVRRLAQRALVRGARADDRSTQAEAALVLSHAYVLESRFSLARLTSARASRLFVADSNATGQAEALAILSYSASALGLDAQALQAADDGIALRHASAAPLGHACGMNYLGVASFWAGDFATARRVLEASIWFADQAGDASVGFQPLVNLCFVEVLRIVDAERKVHGGAADLSELEQLVSRARTMAATGKVGCFNPGIRDIAFVLLDFSCCFIASRWGHTEAADAFYLACLERSRRLPANSWLHAVLWWARAERAIGYGDIDKSIASLEAMAEAARCGEHAQLQALAATLESTLRPALNQWDSRS